MEKGIIFDIKRYAINDGPGIRTTIFFKGCPLNCQWCHNPEGIKSIIETIKIDNYIKNNQKRTIGYKINKEELIKIILKDKIFYNESKGGVTFSGGEPLMQINFLQSMLIECKKNDIHTVLDTCGYSNTNEIDKICDYVDLFLYDLKFIDENKHIKYTGKSNLIILKNLKYLTNKDKKIQIRIPLIPNITDNYDNLNSIKEYVENLENISEICILPYNKLAESKKNKLYSNIKIQKHKTQSNEKLNDIKQIFQSNKYKIKIGG